MADSADSLSWWRIVVGTDGKVTSCEAVEERAPDSETVIYVQARNRAEAGRRAWNAYTSVQNKKRRAEYVKQGRCPACGRKQDRGAGKRCSVCLESHREHRARHDARQRGEEVAAADRSATIARRATDERKLLRLGVLREVEEAWRSANTNKSFTAWLNSQIEAITGRRVA